MRVARPEPPTPYPSHRTAATARPRRLALLLVAALALVTVVPVPARAAEVWTRNLYASGAFLYQDPYSTACTAASTMIMLNTIAIRRTGGPGFHWTRYRVKHNATDPHDYRDMTSILYYERRRDTLHPASRGSDAHGWRNALNYYGWGSAALSDPDLMVYQDLAYRSLDEAVHAAVRAIARFGMPVGILAWAGQHAQVMTGYIVTGEDPAVSDDFVVNSVYLSDPLYRNHVVNLRINLTSLRSGALRYRFQWYRETDSPYDDPYTAGWIRSSVSPTVGRSQWYHRWVIVAPVRQGLPEATPTPDPTPTPDATPTPGATPTPEPTPTADPTPTPTTDATPTPDPAPTPQPAPDPTPTASLAG